MFAADLSLDGSIVAYWATTVTADGIPTEAECRNPDSPVCGTLFIYDVAADTTVSFPFGVRLGGLGSPGVSVAVANNGLVATSGDGLIRSGTFLIDGPSTAGPNQISAQAIAVDLTDDGRYLAYLTSSGPFIYDATTGVSTEVSVAWPEIDFQHEMATTQLDISDDGRFLVFASVADVSGASPVPCVPFTGQELPFCRHVYLIDRETDQVELISVSDSG